MITVIDGLTGSGKTWFMSRLLYKRAKKNDPIYPNLNLKFGKYQDLICRWFTLDELYTLTNGVIAIDEGQKLFGNRAWPFLPVAFADLIASQRHMGLDVITTTQDFGHIDVKVRDNVHERYSCRSLFRFPKNERMRPLFQVIKIRRKTRSFDDLVGIKWLKGSARIRFISRLWTRELYNTYANINLSHFVCQVKREKKKWLIIIQSRQLLNQRTLHR